MTKTLLQTLPEGPLAIIGDIHGEIDALEQLLDRLQHEVGQGRHLVFIGDLCDRGPDSVGVIRRVQNLIEQGVASCILGNHEINLLSDDAKDGSGWYFDSRAASDAPYYSPFTRADDGQRSQIREFIATLPLALHHSRLRIVHASWDDAAIAQIQDVPQTALLEFIQASKANVEARASQGDLLDRYLAERLRWAREIEDADDPPPYLAAVAAYEALEQQLNPIKRLTSGIEAPSPKPFYSGNRWRYSDRTAWWNDYRGDVPVVIGHYWRMFDLPQQAQPSRYSLLFQGQEPTRWLGGGGKVFCVDYSVGARWRERKAMGHAGTLRFRLAALRWPENTLIFDDGEEAPTQGGGCQACG